MTSRSLEKPTFISLFSGCGGFDHGFIEAGYNCLGAYDIDSKVLDVNRKNLGSPIYEYDLSSGYIPYKGKVDVLLAGSPCQGFSTAGKRRLNDPRNHLVLSAALIAKQLLPKVVVVENVPGILAGKHKSYWDSLHNVLRSSGYQTTELVRSEEHTSELQSH